MTVVYVILAVLGLFVLCLVVAVVLLHSYKVTHPYTETDLQAAGKQSVARSRSVVTGQVKEHLVPLLPEWPYSPREAKFLGQPVDYIVFEGLEDNHVTRIVFVEVKTGKSTLNRRERSVRDAVINGRIEYEEIRLSGYEEVAGAGLGLLPPAEVDLAQGGHQ